MNILQHEAHKCFIKTVATVDPLTADPFTMTTIDPENVEDDKGIFYSWVDSQVVTELIKNILTNAEYSKIMLKKNIFTFQDDTTGNKIIDGPCLLKLLFYCIDPNAVVGVKVLRQNLEATKLHPNQNYIFAMITDMEES